MEVTMIQAISLILIALFMAWRYSKTEADPDIAMFSMQAVTGARYGRDFVDCKTPFIHWWFVGIGKLVGNEIENIKFAHHLIVGLSGLILYLVTGNFWGALVLTVLINSGWLWTFTGNIGQVPAALLVFAIAGGINSWVACTLAVLAVLMEPKLLPTFIALGIIYAWYIPSLIWLGTGIIIAIILYMTQRQFIWWLYEAVILIPKRMNQTRRKHKLYEWSPWFTSQAVAYFLPWIIFAVWARPDPLYWLPAFLYLLFISFGMVIRPHHLIPLIPWIAMAGIDPVITLALVSVDFVSSGLYLGDIWTRFYRGFITDIRLAKMAGEFLKGVPGILWVNGMHSHVYTYAMKAPPFGLIEQVEINQVALERRKIMQAAWTDQPPEWVVITPGPQPVQFDTSGFRLVNQFGPVKVYGRGRKHG